MFFGDKTEKESLTGVYKDSKNVKKGKRWRERRDNPRARKIEMAKKAVKNTEKKENKWMEDEQKEGIKRQNRHSKRENVE